jgi:hypothetical protein
MGFQAGSEVVMAHSGGLPLSRPVTVLPKSLGNEIARQIERARDA